MDGFTKLHAQIITSTIWRAPDHVRIVWITMLALANKHGEVSASIPGLAAVANVEISACERALEALSGPDKYSRTQDYDGRRIEAIDGGWRLLNYLKYRRLASAEDALERDAERKRRDRKRPRTSESVREHPECPPIAEAESEAEEKAEGRSGSDARARAKTGFQPSPEPRTMSPLTVEQRRDLKRAMSEQ